MAVSYTNLYVNGAAGNAAYAGSTDGAEMLYRANVDATQVSGAEHLLENMDSTGWGATAPGHFLIFDITGSKDWCVVTEVNVGDDPDVIRVLWLEGDTSIAAGGKAVNVGGAWDSISTAGIYLVNCGPDGWAKAMTEDPGCGYPRVYVKAKSGGYTATLQFTPGVWSKDCPLNWFGYDTNPGDIDPYTGKAASWVNLTTDWGTSGVHAMNLNSAGHYWVTFHNLGFKHSNTLNYYFTSGCYAHFVNCKFWRVGNSYMLNYIRSSLTRCYITTNTSTDDVSMIGLSSLGSAIGCRVHNSAAISGTTRALSIGGFGNTIKNCIVSFVNSTAGIGIRGDAAGYSSQVIEGNILYNAKYGLYLSLEEQARAHIFNNLFHSIATATIYNDTGQAVLFLRNAFNNFRYNSPNAADVEWSGGYPVELSTDPCVNAAAGDFRPKQAASQIRNAGFPGLFFCDDGETQATLRGYIDGGPLGRIEDYPVVGRVIDVETVDGLAGTFVNISIAKVKDGEKWGENGTEFEGEYVGGEQIGPFCMPFVR